MNANRLQNQARCTALVQLSDGYPARRAVVAPVQHRGKSAPVSDFILRVCLSATRWAIGKISPGRVRKRFATAWKNAQTVIQISRKRPAATSARQIPVSGGNHGSGTGYPAGSLGDLRRAQTHVLQTRSNLACKARGISKISSSSKVRRWPAQNLPDCGGHRASKGALLCPNSVDLPANIVRNGRAV